MRCWAGKTNNAGLGMFAQVSIRNFDKYGVVWELSLSCVAERTGNNILSALRSIDVATDSQSGFRLKTKFCFEGKSQGVINAALTA